MQGNVVSVGDGSWIVLVGKHNKIVDYFHNNGVWSSTTVEEISFYLQHLQCGFSEHVGAPPRALLVKVFSNSGKC
jgi:hypothetical protein